MDRWWMGGVYVTKQTAKCSSEPLGGGVWGSTLQSFIFPTCLKTYTVESWKHLREIETYQPKNRKNETKEVAGDPSLSA